MSLPVYTLLTIGWGGYFLNVAASKELKQEVLPKIASGEWPWGINVTEPGGGSDVAAVKCQAIRNGDKYILNGEKAYISLTNESQTKGGGHSSLMVTDPSKGIKGGMSMFAIIPNQLKGMTSHVYKDMGRMGLSTGGFVYKNSEMDKKYLIGRKAKVSIWPWKASTLPGRSWPRHVCGGAEKCLEIAVDYAKQRQAFGKSISRFQGISFDLAEDYHKLEMAKLLLQKGCWMCDTYYSEPGSFTQKDINIVIAQCKLEAPLLSVEIAKHAIMVLGAFGYTKESPLEMAMRGLMSYVSGAEGAYNIMKTIIARDALVLSLSTSKKRTFVYLQAPCCGQGDALERIMPELSRPLPWAG